MRKGRFLNEAQQFRRGVVYDADRKLEAMKSRRKMDNVRLMEKVRESAFLPFPRAHSDYLEVNLNCFVCAKSLIFFVLHLKLWSI